MPKRSTALLATLGITAIALALPSLFRKKKKNKDEDDELYAVNNQPDWAPPGWAFPVAWTVNTIALAATMQHILLRPNHPRRGELLTYLTMHWAIYSTFSRAYFDEKSPMLALGWTAADFAVCQVAFFRALGVNDKVAQGFLPVNLWLAVALPLSAYQAAANRDPLFGNLGIETGEIIAGMLGVTPISAESIERISTSNKARIASGYLHT